MNTDILLEAIGQIDDADLMEAKTEHRKKTYFSVKKGIAAAVAAVLCLLLSVPAFALAGNLSAYDLLYELSPKLAAMIGPIQTSCVSNGIRIDVISATVYKSPGDVYGHVAEILLAAKDLEGFRMDETTDLFEAGSFFAPYPGSAGTTKREYDRETGEAFAVVSISRSNGENLYDADLYSIHISRILSGKKVWADWLPDSVLSDTAEVPSVLETSAVEMVSGNYTGAILKPASAPLFQPLDRISVTAVGYLDGTLHVQTKPGEIEHGDEHAIIDLQDVDGNFISWESVTFIHNGEGYVEYIFSVPYEELADCRLHGDFVSYDQVIEGDWKLTFRLEDIASALHRP